MTFCGVLLATSCAAPSQGGASSSSDSNKVVDESVSKALAAEGPVDIVDHSISSSSIQAAVLTGALKAFGAPAKTVPFVDYAATFPALAKQDDLVEPEAWRGLYEQQFAQYVEKDKSVVSVRPSDLTNAEGWYVPTYVIKGDAKRGIKATCPELPDYKALNKCIKTFKTAQSGAKGQYTSGAESWGPAYGDDKRIANLGLNYTIKYAGSEAALNAEWARAYERGEPFLGLMWTPTYTALKYDLTRVEFPPYSAKCWQTTYACNWGPMGVQSLVGAGFVKAHPTALKILKKYTLSDADVRSMMLNVQEKGMTNQQAAQAWLDANPKTWQAWGEVTP